MLKHNRNLKKIIVVVVTTFCVLYAAVFVVCKFYLNPKELKSILVTKLESNLNRKVSLADDLSLGVSWNLSPYIQLRDVSIGNSSGGQQPNMLSIQKLELKLSLWKLIFKTVYIDSLILINPNVYLETNNGKNNWDFDNKAATTNKDDQSSGISLEINKVIVVNGLVSYKQNGKAARIVKLDKLVAINSGSSLYIPDLDLHVGSSNLSGNITIDKSKLNISGDLKSSLLSMHDFSDGSSGGGGEYSIPSIEIPVQKLKAANIDLSIDVKKLELSKLVLANVALKARTKNQVLNIGLDPAATLFNSKLDLDLAYDLKPNVPTLSFNLKTSGLKLENFVPVSGSAMELKSNLTSSGANLNTLINNLNGKILATASPGAYLNSSTGFSNLLTTILSSAITFEKAKPSTSFQCAVVNLKVNNGVANTNNGIALEAATVNVVGSGKIDLRNGRLNLSINPQNLGNNPMNISQFSMAQLVNVSGTISSPSVNLNPIGLIAGAAMSKTILSSIAGGLPGGLASIAGGMVGKKAESSSQNNQASDICKKALAM